MLKVSQNLKILKLFDCHKGTKGIKIEKDYKCKLNGRKYPKNNSVFSILNLTLVKHPCEQPKTTHDISLDSSCTKTTIV